MPIGYCGGSGETEGAVRVYSTSAVISPARPDLLRCMLSYYYTPDTCALATHIVLEEVGAQYETYRIDFATKMQAFESYLCSTLHVAPARRMRGCRWTDDATAIEALKRRCQTLKLHAIGILRMKPSKGLVFMARTIPSPDHEARGVLHFKIPSFE